MNTSSTLPGRSLRRRIAIAVAGLCTITLCWWGWVAPDTMGENCRLDANAAWISVDWTSQPVDPGLVSALAENAAKRKLQYLYPFAAYVKQEGLIGSEVELLMGLSVSRERTLTHWPDAENMRSGLVGICAGLESRHTGRHPVSGVAIYAAWEATTGDWQTWDEWSTSSYQK